jgi:hypothetical protein
MVKKINILFFLIPILLLACSIADKKKESSVIYFESGFSLHQDTVYVDIKGEMTHALKYHDKFFVLYKQRILKYGGIGKRWLYIFSNGQVERIIDFPKEMETIYLDFYAKNDSLIYKTYMDDQSYYLDLKNFKWIKINKTDDLIFEDEQFLVFSIDFGEWGGKTWFKDKKTGQEYVIEATTPLVNKIDTTYYLTSPYEVLKIENPRLLNKCSNDITYEKIETTEKFYSWYGKPIGFDIVFQDTTFDYFDYTYKPHIVSSFVLNKELLHIYETDTGTYIARHKRHSIEPIQKIIDSICFYNWHFSYRCSNVNRNNELLKFHTENESLDGLMEIIDNKIYIHYISNKAELKPKTLGIEQANKIFKERFNFIFSDLGHLRLKEVDLAEQKWKSFDITPNHEIGIDECYYPNPNKFKIDTAKSYLIQEDSLISNSIIYYATKENGLIRVVSCDWEETDFHQHYNDQTKELFKRKIILLENFLTKKLGKPNKVEVKKNYSKKVWKTSNGFTINIEYIKDYNRIRLIIYKQ